MSGDPSDVRSAPVYIIVLQIEHGFGRVFGVCHVASRRVNNAFRLSRGSGREQNEQRVLAIHRLCRPFFRSIFDEFRILDVPSFFVLTVAISVSQMLYNDHFRHFHIGAAVRDFVHRYVDNRLQRNHFSPSVSSISRQNGFGVASFYSVLERICREASEHHAVNRSDTRTGQSRHHEFGDHWHVNDDSVAFLDVELLLQLRGHFVDAFVQLRVSHLADLA
mmetsp:Transcript_30114/g.52923  ORF Transcript_30114/g.52923 Transcript_30114/m.52923 type:complete len:220 (-) Transcript_30114:814-1473(-)